MKIRTNSPVVKKILVTSALPYANGPLHFGHIAGAYLPGDCYARFQRLIGNEVLYICGSDEYGVAITLSAELANRTPREQVDYFHSINASLFQRLHFSFDHYSRTTWSGHASLVQEFFVDLDRGGFVEARTENHLYSEVERRFLADRYVVGTCPKCGYDQARGDECQKCAGSYEATDLKNPRSKMSGTPLVLKPSEHLYLRFDLFKDRLKEWLEKKDWKQNVIRFAMSYVDDLKPRAITRDSEWGVPVPNRPGKVFYVWFDAPIGYLSATKEWAEKQGDENLWKKFWLDPETKLVQFIGKDNIPFHAVFFPAMLMGQNTSYKLPDEIPANEFLMLEGRQFSKSDHWTIDMEDFFQKYTADQARYALAANAPESADSEFSWKDFQKRCNSELLGKFGNFINRVLVFAKNHCGSSVPSIKSMGSDDEQFIGQIQFLMEQIELSYSSFHLRKACQQLMELAQLGNAYFDAKKPWVAVKDPERKGVMETTIAGCIYCISQLALASSAIIPQTAQKVWQMLGFETELASQSWQAIRSMSYRNTRHLPDPEICFRKIEDEEIEAEISKLGKKSVMPGELQSVALYPALKESIPFDQVAKLDLRVAQILEAVRIPKSKKLLKLLVDVGFEKRTIVSGIALSYEPDGLVGKKVVLVANLSPATIMGIESKGMILAASFDGKLELPQIQSLPPGSSIS